MLTATGDVASELVLRSSRGRIALAATVGASAMASLDATVVNVALPHIASDLDADVTALQWVLTGYLLGLSSFILLAGALGDRLGTATHLRHRNGLVRRCVAAVRCGTERRRARRDPDPPGRGRRAPHAGEHGDPAGQLPRVRPGGGRRRVVGARRCRRCRRALHRRRIGGRTRVALGVPDQRPSVRRGHRVRPRGDTGEPGRARFRQARHSRRRSQRRRTRVRHLGTHRSRCAGLGRCRRGGLR